MIADYWRLYKITSEWRRQNDAPPLTCREAFISAEHHFCLRRRPLSASTASYYILGSRMGSKSCCAYGYRCTNSPRLCRRQCLPRAKRRVDTNFGYRPWLAHAPCLRRWETACTSLSWPCKAVRNSFFRRNIHGYGSIGEVWIHFFFKAGDVEKAVYDCLCHSHFRHQLIWLG